MKTELLGVYYVYRPPKGERLLQHKEYYQYDLEGNAFWFSDTPVSTLEPVTDLGTEINVIAYQIDTPTYERLTFLRPAKAKADNQYLVISERWSDEHQ